MLARLAAVAVLALLLAPGASAFSSDPRAVELAYALAQTPAVVATGTLRLEGALGDGLLLAGADGATLGPIPELTVTDREGTQETYRQVTLVLERGALVWPFEDGASLDVALGAPYGFALALPQAPVPSADGESAPGFLLASEALAGEATWSGAASRLLLADAVVTLEDASGQPLPNWDGARVNVGASGATDESAFRTLFETQGAFDARLAAGLVAGAVGEGRLALSVRAAPEERFDETLQLLRDVGGDVLGSEGGPGPFDEGGPLSFFSGVSGMLNGALFVVPGSGDGGPAAQPLRALVGGEALELGPFSILRGGELGIGWEEGEMRIAGEPDVVLGRDGFAIEPPATVGIVPLVSVVLWALALGAIVWFFVRRPPEAKASWTLRGLSLLANLVILVAVFLVWDASFAATFGTSAVGVARAEGISPETLPQIGTVLALELVPWGIAALLFALPVRIVAGVALRYLGKGKSFKGLANGAGLVALAVLGPIYALWCFNLVLARAFAAIG